MTPDHEALRASTTEGLPLAPSLGPVLDELREAHEPRLEATWKAERTFDLRGARVGSQNP